jgi:hypothetical protein
LGYKGGFQSARFPYDLVVAVSILHSSKAFRFLIHVETENRAVHGGWLQIIFIEIDVPGKHLGTGVAQVADYSQRD